MREEDKPQVVVLENSDISKEELDKEVAKIKEEEDRKFLTFYLILKYLCLLDSSVIFYINLYTNLGKLIEEGKITFKKPIKRKAGEEEKVEEKKSKEESKPPPKKTDSRLLSFVEDEDE